MHGSCACGGVRFQLLAAPSMMASCHCSRCRKVGASTFVFVKGADLRLITGADLIARFEPEPPYKYARSFCRRCGSALGEIGSTAESFPVAANLFDESLDMRPRFHEFVAEKPDWYEISDTARQFAGHPHRDPD